MEPVITTIAAAVALGAAAGLKDTASKAVIDAYAGLKKLIQDRYQKNEDVTDAMESNEPGAQAADVLDCVGCGEFLSRIGLQEEQNVLC